MTHIKLDPDTHDIQVINGRTALVTGAESTAQLLKTRLLLIKGEAIPDKEEGVDYFGRVFGANAPARKPLADAEFKRVILATPGVRRLISYASTVTGRALTATVRVEYDDGTEGTLTVGGIE